MSDFKKSSSELIEKIRKYVEADGQSFLSSKTIDFINDEYVKERERIIYDVNMNVEELHFHNLTTVFNLEKLWDILHKYYVVKKGRKPKVSPIDVEVLDTLKCSINNIIEGEKQRCPDIFAFGEPAPTPDFTIGGYKIPDSITFKGVKRGRNPSALNNYSFIVSYNASKLDPMGPTESNNVAKSDIKSDNVVDEPGLKSDAVVDKSDLELDSEVIDKPEPESDNTTVGSDHSSDNIVINVDSSKNESINKIRKYAGGTILGNDKCCNLGYHVDILRKKPINESTVNTKPRLKPVLPITLTSTIVYTPNINVYTTKKIEMNRCVFEPAKFSFSNFKKPSPLSSASVNTSVGIKSSIPLYNIPLYNSPCREPVKVQVGPGRREGSKNKIAEEKQEIENNKLPRGRQRGSENIGATAKKDIEVIMRDDEIMLRVIPNLFEVHMIKYTIDNAEKSYAQWIGHAHEIINCLNEKNKKISETCVKEWERTVFSAIEEICSKLKKPEESESRRERIKNKYMRMGSGGQNFDEIHNLKNGRYIDTESDNVKTAVDEMHMLLRSFKNDKMISDILRNALTQMNALDESKLDVMLDTDDVVIPVNEVSDVSEIDDVSSVTCEMDSEISEIDILSEVDYDVSGVSEIDEIEEDVNENNNCENYTSDSSSGVDEFHNVMKHNLNYSSDSDSTYQDDMDIISDIIDTYVHYDNNSADVENITLFNTENMTSDNIYTSINETEIINGLIKKDDDHDRVIDSFNNFVNNNFVNNNINSGVNNVYQVNVPYIEIIHELITNIYRRINIARDELVNYCEKYVKNRNGNVNGNSVIMEKNRNRYFLSTINRKRKLKCKKIRIGSNLW